MKLMKRNRLGECPVALARVRARFERWRGRRALGTRIPDVLWDAAVKLAETYGVARTASALRLDYYSLKRRLEEVLNRSVSQPEPRCAAAGSQPGWPEGMSGSEAAVAGSLNGRDDERGAKFVELSGPSWNVSVEWTLEWEHPDGSQMRVFYKGPSAPDLAALSRSFWERRS